MSSQSGSKAAKKRAGRKRQPPLAPGPALQFVVASHPDQFKDENTMRHVRSHVMYKHRGEQQGSSPTDRSKSRERRHGSRALTRTPSPIPASFDGYLDNITDMTLASQPHTLWDDVFHKYMTQSPSIDPARNLVARIIAAITAEPARSTPGTLEEESEYPFPPSTGVSCPESLDDLRELYWKSLHLFDAHDAFECKWMRILCGHPMTFLGQLSVVCVYQDVADGLLHDTPLTIHAKTKLIRMITESLNSQTDDFAILSILHLLVSEIGGQNDDVFDVHQDGLLRIVQQRGGMADLGLDYYIAIFICIVLLTFCVLRGRSEPAMLHGFTPNPPNRVIDSPLPFSPLYAPKGNISSLYRTCPDETFELIRDMQDLTQMFIGRWSYPASENPLVDAHMEQIYTRLLYRPSTEDSMTPDWVYESCRIAALIYCRSIVQGMPLAQSGKIIYAGNSSSASGTTMISALHRALDHTDRAGHWGNMCGVLLWVYLVGGAASWPSFQPFYGDSPDTQASIAWTRKCFALHAVRACLNLNFDHGDVIVESLRTMLQVQHMIRLRSGVPH